MGRLLKFRRPVPFSEYLIRLADPDVDIEKLREEIAHKAELRLQDETTLWHLKSNR